MSDHEPTDRPLSPALREFGEHLRVAAHRELGRAPVTPRRFRGRSLAVAAAILLGTVGAATAADLISVGTPFQDERDAPQRYEPGHEGARLSMTADDPGSKLPWAIETYETPEGRKCVRAGRLRVEQLGEVIGGEFRPYPRDRIGICGALDRAPLTFGVAHATEGPDRTIVFGRAADGIQRVFVTHDGRESALAVATDGGFLAVFDGRVPPLSIGVLPRSTRR